MAGDESFQQAANSLEKCFASVGYVPLGDEADYKNAPLPPHLLTPRMTVPQDRHQDPVALREEVMRGLPKDLCVFVPGTAFDMSGTRHGRGGGWYDRFLDKNHAPETWVRVGVTKKEIVSKEPLSKQPWDVPMDWLLIYDTDADTWSAHETKAREN